GGSKQPGGKLAQVGAEDLEIAGGRRGTVGQDEIEPVQGKVGEQVVEAAFQADQPQFARQRRDLGQQAVGQQLRDTVRNADAQAQNLAVVVLGDGFFQLLAELENLVGEA